MFSWFKKKDNDDYAELARLSKKLRKAVKGHDAYEVVRLRGAIHLLKNKISVKEHNASRID